MLFAVRDAYDCAKVLRALCHAALRPVGDCARLIVLILLVTLLASVYAASSGLDDARLIACVPCRVGGGFGAGLPGVAPFNPESGAICPRGTLSRLFHENFF